MGLFSSDGKTRAQRKAEAKAMKTKAKLEAKLEAKSARKSQKALRKAEHKFRSKELKLERKNAKAAGKAEAKAAKAQAKTAAVEAKAAVDAQRFSPASVRRYLLVARLVSPIVVPIAYRAAVAARGQLTALQAGRAGVAPDVLRQFSGHGATLHARIATTRSALEKVATTDTSDDASAFVTAMVTRLDNLAIAVDAAEAMPASQRRTAHHSIESELEGIEADILARLGVHGSTPKGA
ncbi:DUF6474 family protein [Gordonia sp. NPDC062954]|jgi:hypothetical protein|uniref:DUF6474 family protein n=1 Tax=unclassified Gordonia (in: high G+C Gram-positive bacteria) TaxID=2657482 RepID=UPI000C386F1A|nr:DUF6474 family protein [Gordonia sp. (in: high G+C Gram-positive bacteria)]MAU84884.1 hypothetical protein [Gordonia sp. (in: high G+C Gram-positive bacteria)]